MYMLLIATYMQSIDCLYIFLQYLYATTPIPNPSPPPIPPPHHMWGWGPTSRHKKAHIYAIKGVSFCLSENRFDFFQFTNQQLYYQNMHSTLALASWNCMAATTFATQPQQTQLRYLIWKLPHYVTSYHQDTHVPPHFTLYNQATHGELRRREWYRVIRSQGIYIYFTYIYIYIYIPSKGERGVTRMYLYMYVRYGYWWVLYACFHFCLDGAPCFVKHHIRSAYVARVTCAFHYLNVRSDNKTMNNDQGHWSNRGTAISPA